MVILVFYGVLKCLDISEGGPTSTCSHVKQQVNANSRTRPFRSAPQVQSGKHQFAQVEGLKHVKS